MKNSLFLFLCFFVTYHISAQTLVLEDSISVEGAELMQLDQKGNIYVVDEKGIIFQYSDELELIKNYSPPKPFPISQLDVWQGLRIFCFYRDIQEFTLLNRFLTSSENFQFNLPFNGFISLATLSYDNNLWLIDQPSMELIKYNINERRVEFDIPLSNIIPVSIFNIVAFREYQNKIYIVDERHGMFIFDNLGNYIANRKLTVGQETDFYDDYLIYIDHEKLYHVNLYNEEQFSVNISLRNKIIDVVRNKEYVYALTEKMLYKYSVK